MYSAKPVDARNEQRGRNPPASSVYTSNPIRESRGIATNAGNAHAHEPYIVRLTRHNSELLQLLASHKAIRRGEKRYARLVIRLATDLHAAIRHFDSMRDWPFASIRPLFSRRTSHEAYATTPLDDYIALRGGTTSSYDQLPHMLEKSKHQSAVPEFARERELKADRARLLAEIKYHEGIRRAEQRFTKDMENVKTLLENACRDLEQAWQQRHHARHDEACKWLGDIGIEYSSTDLEDIVFEDGAVEKL